MACGDLIIQIFEDFRYLAVPAAPRLNPGRPDGVDLVHEDDGGRVLPRHHKQLPHHPAALACGNRAVAVLKRILKYDILNTNELLDKLRSGNANESAFCVMSNCARKQGLAWNMQR